MTELKNQKFNYQKRAEDLNNLNDLKQTILMCVCKIFTIADQIRKFSSAVVIVKVTGLVKLRRLEVLPLLLYYRL